MAKRKQTRRPRRYQSQTLPRAAQAPRGRELTVTTPTLASRLARLPRVSALAALPPAVTIARAIRRSVSSPYPVQVRGTLPRQEMYLPWNIIPPLSLAKPLSKPREKKNPPMPRLKANPCQQRERRKTVLFSLGIAGRGWGRGGPNMVGARRGPLSNHTCR